LGALLLRILGVREAEAFILRGCERGNVCMSNPYCSLAVFALKAEGPSREHFLP
jgi:hypothetical protein